MKNDIIRFPEFAPDGTFTTRTEQLQMYAAQVTIDHQMLATSPATIAAMVEMELREKIDRSIANSGRQVHGEVTLTRIDSPATTDVVFRAIQYFHDVFALAAHLRVRLVLRLPADARAIEKAVRRES